MMKKKNIIKKREETFNIPVNRRTHQTLKIIKAQEDFKTFDATINFLIEVLYETLRQNQKDIIDKSLLKITESERRSKK